MREESYDIGGMHCAACSSAVERVTRKLPGVLQSEVNLPMNRLRINYDEALCSSEAIIQKIERAGFTAALHTDPTTAKKAPNGKDTTLKTEKAALIVSSCFAFLLLCLSMGQMLFSKMPVPDILSMYTHPVNFALLQLLLCIPVLFLGKRFFIGGFTSLFHGNPNMDTLVAISAAASFLYSLAMTFLISDDPHAVHQLYYESAAVVVALVSVGKYLEASSKEKTNEAVTRLMELAPDTVILVDENGQWEVPISKIKAGDTILVKPGAQIPLDGIVTRGTGSVNEAMLTGESMPVAKAINSEVAGGSVSIDAALYVRVTRIGEDTILSKIIRFVEDAQGKKAPISRTADKVAGVFVPIVIVVAFAAGAIWLATGAEFAFALKIFTCILVIACPCAMGLATPTAIIVASGLGAQHGILIRSGEALEITHKISIAIFDKTGTITEGKPVVTDIAAKDELELLRAAFSLERLSEHPLSKAICDYASKRKLTADAVTDFENISGRGLAGNDEQGVRLVVGNSAFIEENGISMEDFSIELNRLTKEGKTVVIVAKGGTIKGLIAIADAIKPDAAKTIAELKQMKLKTVLLTGDNRAAAEFIGKAAGVDEIAAEVLPTEKAEVVKRYQSEGAIVMMVGDGINDAPALTQADVGCAIGNGSDIAIGSADVVLMKSSLLDVCRAIKLSRFTIRNIKQNLFWAFCYNVIGIPIAAGVLYPAFHLLLSPMIGALAMSLSSIFVVTNALRLKGKKL